MTVLTFARPHELAQLNSELATAAPALVGDLDGLPWYRYALWDDGDTIYVDVADELADASRDAIAAAIAAHVPQAPPPPPPPAPDAIEIANALVRAVAGAPDFATAQQQLVDVVAQLPQPTTEGGP